MSNLKTYNYQTEIQPQKRLVVVLGMHRSGTSAVTRGLLATGISFGENLMQPQIGVNEKGFWEDLDIYEFNERLLYESGQNWHSLEPLNYEDINNLVDKGYVDKGIDILKNKLSLCPHFGFKDPRTAKLMAFGREYFLMGDLSHTIFVLRNPISIAKSLLHRNRFEPLFSYYLWLGHILPILKYTKERPILSLTMTP